MMLFSFASRAFTVGAWTASTLGESCEGFFGGPSPTPSPHRFTRVYMMNSHRTCWVLGEKDDELPGPAHMVRPRV